MPLAIVQARMSSTRLPGKVMRPLYNRRPMLELLLERLSRAETIDKLAIATSTDRTDDYVAQFCAGIAVPCYRGSLDNVLERFYCAAEEHRFHDPTIVRITGDCPLIDPAIVDVVVREHLAGGAAYTSNTLVRTWPKGMDVEAMTFDALREASLHASQPGDIEHVTPFLLRSPLQFLQRSVEHPAQRPELNLSVDTEADFARVAKVFEDLYPKNPMFGIDEILESAP